MLGYRDLEKILGLEKPALKKWVRARLSGNPTFAPPQTSKGEDPEDLIISLAEIGRDDFKPKCEAVLVELLQEIQSSSDPRENARLLAGMTQLVDALHIKSATSMLAGFVFDVRLTDQNTSEYGDLQEQMLRCLLGLEPERFDTAFWQTLLTRPKLAAVAIRGLAATDPAQAVGSFPQLVRFVMAGESSASIRLVLWRIAAGWDHTEFLRLLAASLEGRDLAIQEEVKKIVQDLPFDTRAKTLFQELMAKPADLTSTIEVGGGIVSQRTLRPTDSVDTIRLREKYTEAMLLSFRQYDSLVLDTSTVLEGLPKSSWPNLVYLNTIPASEVCVVRGGLFARSEQPQHLGGESQQMDLWQPLDSSEFRPEMEIYAPSLADGSVIPEAPFVEAELVTSGMYSARYVGISPSPKSAGFQAIQKKPYDVFFSTDDAINTLTGLSLGTIYAKHHSIGRALSKERTLQNKWNLVNESAGDQL